MTLTEVLQAAGSSAPGAKPFKRECWNGFWVERNAADTMWLVSYGIKDSWRQQWSPNPAEIVATDWILV